MSREPLIANPAWSSLTAEEDTMSSSPDKAAALCSEWLTWHANHEQLTMRWQALETCLIRHHGWFGLTEQERCGRPEAAELRAMEDELNDLFDNKQQRLRELPDIPATSARALVLKLSVAAASVLPDENEEAHHLLRSVLDDLLALTGLRADAPGL